VLKAFPKHKTSRQSCTDLVVSHSRCIGNLTLHTDLNHSNQFVEPRLQQRIIGRCE